MAKLAEKPVNSGHKLCVCMWMMFIKIIIQKNYFDDNYDDFDDDKDDN